MSLSPRASPQPVHRLRPECGWEPPWDQTSLGSQWECLDAFESRGISPPRCGHRLLPAPWPVGTDCCRAGKGTFRINPHPTASHCGWCMQGLAEHSRALPPPFVSGRIQELETSSTCVCPGMVAPAPSRGPSHLAARPGILVDLPRSWTSFHS